MKIKEVAKLINLPIDTIRYYERIGIVMPINRDHNGIRIFNERNIRQLKFAMKMREAGLSIEALKDYIDLIVENNDKTISVRKELLIESADELEQKIKNMQDTLNYLKYKIDNYNTHMKLSEQDFY